MSNWRLLEVLQAALCGIRYKQKGLILCRYTEDAL